MTSLEESFQKFSRTISEKFSVQKSKTDDDEDSPRPKSPVKSKKSITLGSLRIPFGFDKDDKDDYADRSKGVSSDPTLLKASEVSRYTEQEFDSSSNLSSSDSTAGAITDAELEALKKRTEQAEKERDEFEKLMKSLNETLNATVHELEVMREDRKNLQATVEELQAQVNAKADAGDVKHQRNIRSVLLALSGKLPTLSIPSDSKATAAVVSIVGTAATVGLILTRGAGSLGRAPSV